MRESDSKDLPPYYRYTATALLSTISLRARKRIFQTFMDVLHPTAADTVLDVGATRNANRKESNFFEQFYPFPRQVTAVGVEDLSSLETSYPGTTFLQIQPDQPLPFADRQFDIAFSNAVLEHVGDAGRQRNFVREVTRVSRRGLISIPDRRFPVEHHSSVPFIHWLPGDTHRSLFGRLGFKELATIDNLNLLWGGEFRSLFEPVHHLRTRTVRALGFPSNLLGFYEWL